MTAAPSRGPASDRSWMRDAACRDQPSSWFTDPANPTDLARAMATCAACPVRTACLTTALSSPEHGDAGIWGGTTEATRRRIRSGALDIDDVLATSTPRRVEPSDAPRPEPATEVARLHTREVTVGRTAHGTYESADGRTVIFRIHGKPPWMLLVDDRPIARTDTLTSARRLAWTTQHRRDTRPEQGRFDPARTR